MATACSSRMAISRTVTCVAAMATGIPAVETPPAHAIAAITAIEIASATRASRNWYFAYSTSSAVASHARASSSQVVMSAGRYPPSATRSRQSPSKLSATSPSTAAMT